MSRDLFEVAEAGARNQATSGGSGGNFEGVAELLRRAQGDRGSTATRDAE